MTEQCVRCKEDGEDRRTLWMACFYAMHELGLPFEEETIREGGIHDSHPNESHTFFTLRVCKSCRADWMSAIQLWWQASPKRESCGSGIFIREFGANIEVTEEEFKQRYPGIMPVRVKHE